MVLLEHHSAAGGLSKVSDRMYRPQIVFPKQPRGCRPAAAAEQGARSRRLTGLEWAHEPALQEALAQADSGGLGPPVEVRPEGAAGWALRARRSHLLQASKHPTPKIERGCAYSVHIPPVHSIRSSIQCVYCLSLKISLIFSVASGFQGTLYAVL